MPLDAELTLGKMGLSQTFIKSLLVLTGKSKTEKRAPLGNPTPIHLESKNLEKFASSLPHFQICQNSTKQEKKNQTVITSKRKRKLGAESGKKGAGGNLSE